MISKIFRVVKYFWARRSRESIISYYRSKGVYIGRDVYVKDPKFLSIDISRPSLIEIGDHVFLHKGLRILTHDYASWVFVNSLDDFIPSSGRVKIGNNVWFGENCTVLKGVNIGDNCVIGYGSVVTKNIPSNSVAVGIPAKVICSIEEYYVKRKVQYIDEAVDYALSIIERYNREPTIDDFKDDYPCFVDSRNIDKYSMMPYERVLKGAHFEKWQANHKAYFNGFEEFMKVVNSKRNGDKT